MAKQGVTQGRIARAFPEQRIFLRSGDSTRYLTLKPGTQMAALLGGAAVVGWTIVASAILAMNMVGSARDRAEADALAYQDRLNVLSEERDARAAEARAAHERFSLALAEVSAMQTRLLEAEDGRRELETGLAALRLKLRGAIDDRDLARDETALLTERLAQAETAAAPEAAQLAELSGTVDHLAAALTRTAADREIAEQTVDLTETRLAELELEHRLAIERTDRIFAKIEDAVSISLVPLDEMFASAGLPADRILDTVRRGYTGQGGPLTPITYSTRGAPADPDVLRANDILAQLDEVNAYRIAVEKTPFAVPVTAAHRKTSGFGPRWGRMHEGSDFAAAHGTPILSTAEGTVSFAGKQSGYGNIVKIRHAFGIETRYAHLSRIRVKVGEKVSRGDRIGDMGNTGRSTGTHLHYEVRVDGKAVNPMTYIKAARDVF